MVIKICNCEHVYQDKRYGKKRRVHNPTRGRVGKTFRCTVCGKEQ